MKQPNKPNTELQEYIVARYGRMPVGELAESTAKKFGLKSSYIKTFIFRLRKRGHIGIAPKGRAPVENFSAPRPAVKGRSTSELFAQFDDVQKIVNACKAIPRGEYLTDEEVRRAASVSMDRWRSASLNSKILQWKYALPNRKNVWMAPADQKELDLLINQNY